MLLLPPVQVVVIGEGADARMLATMARARYAVNKQILLLKPEQVTKENLPPILAETLPELPELITFPAAVEMLILPEPKLFVEMPTPKPLVGLLPPNAVIDPAKSFTMMSPIP